MDSWTLGLCVWTFSAFSQSKSKHEQHSHTLLGSASACRGTSLCQLLQPQLQRVSQMHVMHSHTVRDGVHAQWQLQKIHLLDLLKK